jgi:hypothetical protein
MKVQIAENWSIWVFDLSEAKLEGGQMPHCLFARINGKE